jgi:hypothetical protein
LTLEDIDEDLREGKQIKREDGARETKRRDERGSA